MDPGNHCLKCFNHEAHGEENGDASGPICVAELQKKGTEILLLLVQLKGEKRLRNTSLNIWRLVDYKMAGLS